METKKLNPIYTFDNFIIGNNNNVAYTLAYEVAKFSSKKYNPLLLYGRNGLGKTHLMQAIGNYIIQNNLSLNVLYLTFESFFLNFDKEILKNVDVLLMEDIQFLAGKERLQEEIFSIFKLLCENGKKIICSSDRPFNDIRLEDNKLKCGFEWGGVAEISKPADETRLAILKRKVKDKEINVDEQLVTFIASKKNVTIRELEGALNQLMAYAALNKSSITKEMAEKVLKELEEN